MKKLLFVLAASFSLAACTKDNAIVKTPAPGTESLAKTNGKPFTGSISFAPAANVSMPCDCGDFFPAGVFAGTGNLSHLGKSYSVIKPCVAPIFQDNNYVGDHVGVECAYFVAANGDSLYLFTHPYDLLYTPAGAVGFATVDFVGGTGRFKSATGQFTGTVTVGPATATFTNLNGIIYY